MCPDEPTNFPGAAQQDDLSIDRPAQSAADTAASSDSAPGRAKLSESELRRASSGVSGLSETGTPDNTALNLTHLLSNASMSADPPPASATESVPGYGLIAPLGEGGMGVVWKARQMKLNRIVALKMVLGDHRAGSKELIRFLAEAEAVAAVKHPHVVQVYEYGDANGRPFLAMEYLAGGSLADRLKRTGRFDERSAANLVTNARRCGPGGPRLGDRSPRPKALERPLRRARTAQGHRLRPGQASGWQRPDSDANGDGHTGVHGARAGPRRYQVRRPAADVYSLGVILYECLTGSQAIRGRGQARALAEGGGGGARAAREAGAGAAAGRGADLPQVPGEGPG